jgi:predicted kinase/phosphoglycolate phosphatase-like HAD superfamily hydrolase
MSAKEDCQSLGTCPLEKCEATTTHCYGNPEPNHMDKRKPCYIFDIDGTLSDPEHRLHHVNGPKKDWKAFFETMDQDPPITALVTLCQQLQWVGIEQGQSIIITTGRPENYREITEKWLKQNGIEWDKLYMRPANDTRPDAIVKKEILDQIYADKYDPIMVFDDRQTVVDMWRENGLVCAQVAPNLKMEIQAPSKELLYLMVGPTGAGKSTYAKKFFEPREIVSSDELREDLAGDFREQGLNDKVFKVLHKLVKTRLECGLRTCVDATNLHRKDRLAILALCPVGVSACYIVINRPLAFIERDAGWRKEVPQLIEKHQQRFNSGCKDIMSGDGMGVRVIDNRQGKWRGPNEDA